MAFLRKRTVEIDELQVDTTTTDEQSDLQKRLKTIERKLKELQTEVHDLQLAKKKYHGDD